MRREDVIAKVRNVLETLPIEAFVSLTVSCKPTAADSGNILARERTVVLLDEGIEKVFRTPITSQGIPEPCCHDVDAVMLHSLLIDGLDAEFRRRRRLRCSLWE